MYSVHNFYFKPYIALFALLLVINCKGLEAARFIKQKPSIWHCPNHPLAYVANTTTAERHCWVDLILFSGICERAPLWTIVDHPTSQQHLRAWALDTWKEITGYEPNTFSNISSGWQATAHANDRCDGARDILSPRWPCCDRSRHWRLSGGRCPTHRNLRHRKFGSDRWLPLCVENIHRPANWRYRLVGRSVHYSNIRCRFCDLLSKSWWCGAIPTQASTTALDWPNHSEPPERLCPMLYPFLMIKVLIWAICPRVVDSTWSRLMHYPSGAVAVQWLFSCWQTFGLVLHGLLVAYSYKQPACPCW